MFRAFKFRHMMTVLGTIVLAVQALAGEQPVLTTEKDRINYSIGVNIASSMKQQGFDIDQDLVMQGMRDALSGGKLLMSEDDIKKTMLAVQNEVRRRQKMAPIIAMQEGKTFLEKNKAKKGVVVLPNGLQYEVLKKGEGRVPVDTDLVVCNWRGTLLNGTEFDRSYPGSPVTFSVREGAGIPGVSEALKMMPVGSHWQLFIPPQLAFGERGRTSLIGSPVGPNETIIVDLELLEIKK